MLKGIIGYRPTNLCAIYIEARQIEVLRATRKWRSWVVEPAERFHVPEGESIFDFLQYLNMRPKGRKGSALLLFLPSTFYSVHREHYPPSIRDHLEEAINFDWQENIFHEYERTLHFAGPSLRMSQHISVPIFSLPKEIHEKLQQTLNAHLFHTFTILPSALAFESFLPPLPPGGEKPLQILGRVLDGSQLEIHRFFNRVFLDSVLVDHSPNSLKLFSENLRCMGSGDGNGAGAEPVIHLLCTDHECADASGEYGKEWADRGLPVIPLNINKTFVEIWVRQLLLKDTIHTFDSGILLKPWEMPKAVWPVLALVVFFAAYAFFQFNSSENLTQDNKRLRRQLTQLEVQWKPIEELQTRISKFQEDRKTLSEFSREGYPLLELLTYLTQITPEDTWLNYLSLRKGQVVIRGESKSAIRYLSDLSKVDGMTDVKFASPVTRNPTSDMERFNVQLQLDMDKLKRTLETVAVERYETAAPLVPAAGEPPGVTGVEPPPESKPPAPPPEVESEDDLTDDEVSDEVTDEVSDEASEALAEGEDEVSDVVTEEEEQ